MIPVTLETIDNLQLMVVRPQKLRHYSLSKENSRTNSLLSRIDVDLMCYIKKYLKEKKSSFDNTHQLFNKRVTLFQDIIIIAMFKMNENCLGNWELKIILGKLEQLLNRSSIAIHSRVYNKLSFLNANIIRQALASNRKFKFEGYPPSVILVEEKTLLPLHLRIQANQINPMSEILIRKINQTCLKIDRELVLDKPAKMQYPQSDGESQPCQLTYKKQMNQNLFLNEYTKRRSQNGERFKAEFSQRKEKMTPIENLREEQFQIDYEKKQFIPTRNQNISNSRADRRNFQKSNLQEPRFNWKHSNIQNLKGLNENKQWQFQYDSIRNKLLQNDYEIVSRKNIFSQDDEEEETFKNIFTQDWVIVQSWNISQIEQTIKRLPQRQNMRLPFVSEDQNIIVIFNKRTYDVSVYNYGNLVCRLKHLMSIKNPSADQETQLFELQKFLCKYEEKNCQPKKEDLKRSIQNKTLQPNNHKYISTNVYKMFENL